MPTMGKHSPTEAANTRARVSAWLVFISMAGTTMSFQVYHSVKHGDMPWELAWLYGIVPLLVSMFVIEFVSGWDDAPDWVRWFAYLIIGSAMFLSASATGTVVLHAAPNHLSLLFGLLLDGAAILAARFLMTAAKTAAVMKRVAFAAALEAEQSARAEAEAERDAARRAEAETAAKAEDLARQLADTKSKQAGNGAGSDTGDQGRKPRKPRAAAGDRKDEPAADIDIYAAALDILDKEPGISASELGRRLNRSESRGRQIKRELTQAAPQGPDVRT